METIANFRTTSKKLSMGSKRGRPKLVASHQKRFTLRLREGGMILLYFFSDH